MIAQTTRGNVTAGDVLASADARAGRFPRGFSRDELIQNIGPAVAGTQTYSATLGAAGRPIRPFKTVITTTIDNIVEKVQDIDGNGLLAGTKGSYGSINYTTGAVSVTWGPTIDSGDAGNPVTVSYFTDFESQEEIPKLIFRLTTKPVQARVWALKSTVGLEQGYALRRRFGMIADDELAQDLVSAINNEVVNVLIDLLVANAMGNTDFDRTAPSGVSYFEHKQTFMDSLAIAESNMLDNAGRGTINVIVAGRRVCEIVGTLPNFIRLSDGANIGTHIFGTLNNMVVVRVPHDEIMDMDSAYCLYKGSSPFDAPVVWSPYMPLIVTPALPNGANPLLSQKAAATWAAADVLVPTLATKLTVIESSV